MNATSLSTLEGQRRHYDEVRKRLWSTKPKPKPVVQIENVPAPPRKMVIPQWYLDNLGPIWTRQEIYFDAHVKVWQWHRAEISSSKIKNFINARCAELDTTFAALQTQQRTSDLVYKRHIIWREIRDIFGLSYPQIGRMFGGRDHTTILHGYLKMTEFIAFIEANELPKDKPVHVFYSRKTWD